MPHFAKPAEGSWTGHYPELGTGPVDYTDSIDPAYYEAERTAVFRRTWLNVGRVEQVPKTGSYFTRELAVVDTSLIIVRGKDSQIRAFHNICRHRGNKLVWNDFPAEEVKGTCRQFTCKYHAWRYSLDGELTFIQQEEEFFGVDKSAYGLKAVRCEVWEGFIFVNLDPAAQPLADYLGEFAKGLEGYPFGEMTEVFTYKAEVGSNWKLFIDAFAEFYHAPVLHQKQAVKDEADKLVRAGFEGLHYELHDPHAMISSWGGMAPPKDPSMVKPIERVLRSGLFGPWDRPDIAGLDPLPPALNPSGHRAWGVDSFHFFPNFMLLIWAPGWYLTYHYWPTAVDRHIFEANLYFVPAKTAGARLAQELAAVTFKEYALQDANTLEATQSMLNSRVVSEFPLCDQELLLRALHKVTADYVKEHTNVVAG
jgi:phenylpropionate dioxygenase-like ring-hydroxylating dioxygenase large terminal subunit